MYDPMQTESTPPAELAAGPVAAVGERDLITVTGEASLDYLQGQVSQDVGALEPGQVAWSLVLQPQGKVDSWFRVTRFGDRIELDVDRGWGEATVARLERFKLRTPVEFELRTVPMVSVRGAGSSGIVGGRPVAWGDADGVDLLDSDRVPDGVVLAGDAVEWWRVAAGFPRLGAELTDATIPAEVPGVVEASVSFTKGCYVGQELVARVDSRGNNTPRTVRRLVVEGGLPEPGAEVRTEAGEEAGVVTSVASAPEGALVLASIKRSAGDETSFTITDLPASRL